MHYAGVSIGGAIGETQLASTTGPRAEPRPRRRRPASPTDSWPQRAATVGSAAPRRCYDRGT
ncbi:hypothetical protein HBB16_12350 [Pseudonocardia sp. MCCB 268]|nr:hypothetical protein [Pseudonocardia cytotoxica]